MKFKILDNGDDCNVILERSNLSAFKANLVPWFRNHGFSLKIENVAYDLFDIFHCQANPAYVYGKYTMVKYLPRVAIREGNTVRSVRTEEDWAFFRSAISCGGIADFSGIPVIQDWFWKLGEGTARIYDIFSPLARRLNRFEWRFIKGRRDFVAHYRHPDFCSRMWFAYKYKMLYDEQVDVENKILTTRLRWHTEGQHKMRTPVSRYEFLQDDVHWRWPYIWKMGSV